MDLTLCLQKVPKHCQAYIILPVTHARDGLGKESRILLICILCGFLETIIYLHYLCTRVAKYWLWLIQGHLR